MTFRNTRQNQHRRRKASPPASRYKTILRPFPDARRILAIDPGKAAGFALFDGGKLGESGAVDGDDVFAIWDVIKRCEPDAIVVEDQFIGKNPQTAMTLVLLRGHWETIGLLLGIPVQAVPPATWQAWAHIRPGAYDQYVAVAAGILGRQPESHDEAVAILLGLFFVSTIQSPRIR